MQTLENIRLNPYQLEAVEDESRACLVNANVGSGKTTVLIHKIRRLHEEKKVLYGDMVVLTFTNKAAGEIRERLQEEEPLPTFGTFHSVARMLLRERLPVEELGYTENFSVIEPDDEADLARELIHTHELKIKYANRLKKRLENEKVSRYGDDLEQLRILLAQEKRRLNVMSFQDLIVYCVELLERCTWRPAWIICDEVQDADLSQLEMIRGLMGEKTHLFAVGDPNQVIYGWRGSSLGIFRTLKKEYDARELSLPINYRCSGEILEAASIFKQDGMRQKLTAAREAGDKILGREVYDAFQDADYLAGRIRQLYEEGIAYEDMAVLYRLQSQAELFARVFEREGIPRQISVRKTMQDIPALAFVIRLLQFALHPDNPSAYDLVMTDKVYGPGLTRSGAAKVFKGDAKGKQKAAGLLLEKARAFRKSFGPGISIYDYFELGQWLCPTAASFEEDDRRVRRFFARLEEAAGIQPENSAERLEAAFAELSLGNLSEIEEIREEGVHLMTLHACKGLEFSQVFITGVNDGLIPLRGDYEQMDEERRLFFVGMTRAKDGLELSWYLNPDERGVLGGPGRFIRMIPEERIRIEGKSAEKTDLRQLRDLVLEEIRRGREVKEEKPEETAESEPEKPEEPKALKTSGRKVSHAHYGVGEVLSEDDLMICVRFDGYGEKEFMKMFSELTDL